MAALTVPDALDEIFHLYSQQIALVHKQPFFRQTWTYAQLHSRIEAMQAFLGTKHIQKGDRVAICAPNSPWWITVYLACGRLGAVVVPLDFNSSSEFIDTVLQETEAKLLFKSVYKPYVGHAEIIVLEDMASRLQQVGPADAPAPQIQPDDMLEIVFTSGSTGTPKGVMLTHRNVMSNVANFLAAWPAETGQTSLSLVPLSHMLEQTVGFWAPFRLGFVIVYIASLRPSEIASAIAEERVSSIITVPAFLQLLRRRILAQVEGGGLRPRLARELIGFARHVPRPVARGLTWPIRRKLGGRLETLAVGGALLPPEVEEFWLGLGYRVMQGYGLTETSPLATYSSLRHTQPRSVGKGLPNQELRLAPSGELLLRGPHVFRGYYHNAEATHAVLDSEGWLHTGDIAAVDADGFVFLKGRLKNMLLGSNGLNIYPEDIETKLLDHTEIRDAVVLMDGRADDQKLTAVVLTDAAEDVIKQLIKEVNKSLSSHQTIQRHIIWPDSDFPRTPTRKVRRQAVQEAVDQHRTDEPFTPSQDTSVLHALLRQVSGATTPITDELVIASDLGVDSIKRLELVTLIEEKLLVSIDETIITATTTVGQLASAIEAARKQVNTTHQRVRQVTRHKPVLFLQSCLQAALCGVVARFQKLSVEEGQLKQKEAVIYVANHTSHFDAPTFLRLAGFQGRQELVVAAAADYFFRTPLRSWLARNIVHAVPVEREGSVRSSLERIGRELSAGRSVVIFPEGSRSLSGQIQPFKPGVGLLAAELQVPVVPVGIVGNFALLPKGSRWPKPASVRVRIGTARTYSVTQSPLSIADDLQKEVEKLCV